MTSHILNAIFSRKSAAALLGTGCYVTYSDLERYRRMNHVFDTGNMTYPLRSDVTTPKTHFTRPELEKEVRKILAPTFSGQFYLIRGDVGTGKSYLVQKVVRGLVEGRGREKEGAPVYLDCAQGKNFADTLAEAVKFYFDEHINFRYLALLLFGIEKLPKKDDSNKLLRVLDAIERSSYHYAQKKGRPTVLVVDNIDQLALNHKNILEKLLEKAKLWSDTNICKVVFVCSLANTEKIFMENSAVWIRQETPLTVGDLTEREAREYVRESLENCDVVTGDSQVFQEIYDCVGGRMIYLQNFIQKIKSENNISDIKKQMIVKELEKFEDLPSGCPQWKFLEFLNKFPNKECSYSSASKEFPDSVISNCSKRGFIEINRQSGSLRISFASKLTETTFSETIASQK